jgi:hypothetical protein
MLLSVLVALVAAASVPPQGHATLRVGVAENNFGLFDDARFTALNVRDVRVVAPFDVMRRGGFARDRLRQYLLRARARGIRPLVTFEHSAGGGAACHNRRAWHRRQCRLPSVRQYERDLRRFVRAFPWVRQIAPWNEANHYTQPTSRNPAAAAHFANVARRVCRRCTIVLADVLDQADHSTNTRRHPTYNGTRSWIRRYRRALKVPRRVCGVHNYSDSNRFRSTGTRAVILALGCRQIWLTETGGIYHLGAFRPNARRQARAIRWMFRLARGSRRVKRIYVYTWFGGMTPGFDSGLVLWGHKRRAFTEFRRHIRSTGFAAYAR